MGLLQSLIRCQRDVETVPYKGKDPFLTAVAAWQPSLSFVCVCVVVYVACIISFLHRLSKQQEYYTSQTLFCDLQQLPICSAPLFMKSVSKSIPVRGQSSHSLHRCIYVYTQKS